MQITTDRPLDIVAQFDGKRFAFCFGIQPDHRDYRITTRNGSSGRYTFVRCWAFVFIVALFTTETV